MHFTIFLFFVFLSPLLLATPAEWLSIYESRVNQAAADLRAEEAEVIFQKSKLARLKKLLESKSVSVEDFERAQANFEIAQAKTSSGSALLIEKQAELAIARQKIESGEPIPLCR